MHSMGRNIARWLALMAAALLVACGGGGGGAGSAPTYTVGGTVSGLVGTGLVLQVNGSGNLAIPANGTYSFPGVVTGTAYAVTVLTQPTSPAQSCAVANGSGSVAAANVTNITVTCTTLPTFSVGGTVSGLAGSGLSLRNNGTDTRTISTDGPFVFTTELLNSATYAVTVATQPASPAQSCTIANGTGTIASLDVSNVAITCVTVPTFAVGGSVSGLERPVGTVTGIGGNGLVLRNNGGDDRSVVAVGTFTFATPIALSSTYSVTVAQQPTMPVQACSVTSGAGTVTAAVTTVAVNCVLPTMRFVYVTTRSNSPTLNQLTAYNVIPTTGSLTVASTTLAGTTAASVSVDPDGRFAYIANSDANAISVVSVNPTSGSLTSVGAIAAGIKPEAVGIDPRGRFAYAVNFSSPSTVSAYRINAGNGVLSSAGSVPTGDNPTGVSVDPTGQFVYVANSGVDTISSYRISAPAGSISLTGTVTTGDQPAKVAMDPLGRFVYVPNVVGDSVSGFALNSATGVLTPIDLNGVSAGVSLPTGTNSNPSFIAIDPLGKFAYVVLNNDNNLTGNSVAAFSINETTGVLTSLGPIIPAGTAPFAAVVDTSGQFLYVLSSGPLGGSGAIAAFSINSSSGALTAVPGGFISVGANPSGIAAGR
jgi:6-phosphogluconolactonase (cycloisomerase 2 family)